MPKTATGSLRVKPRETKKYRQESPNQRRSAPLPVDISTATHEQSQFADARCDTLIMEAGSLLASGGE